MKFFIALIVIFSFELYCFQAIRYFTHSLNTFLKYFIYFVFWAIPVLTVAYMAAYGSSEPDTENKLFHTIVRALIFIILLSQIVMAVPLVLDDLRRLSLLIYDKTKGGKEVFDYSRNKFLTQMSLILGSLPFITLTYGIVRNPYRYKLYTERIKINGLPERLNGLKIVQISDIHSGSFTLKDPVKRAVEMINEQNADIVFFTGDLVNDIADEMEHFMDVFDKIKSKYGVFSVLGNHDYGEYYRWNSKEAEMENMKKMYDTHQKLGWRLLINENEILKINDEDVAIIGVENYSMKPRFPRYGDLKKAYQGAENASLKLLLSHDPSHWKGQVTPEYTDIHVTFSGHTHGMQFGIEIPGWIKWSPIKYMYKEWAGLYHENGQYLYVNRGLGFLGYPGRVGILPEVAVLTLEA